MNEIGVPADGNVISLDVRKSAGANELAWTDSTSRARTFYRVYRASPSRGFPDTICQLLGGRRCELRAETLVTTRDQTYVDPDPPADASYRIGVAANWLDDPEQGDVFAISPPVAPTAGVTLRPVRDRGRDPPLSRALCVFSEGGPSPTASGVTSDHYEGFARRILDGAVPYGDFTRRIPAVRAAGVRRARARDLDRPPTIFSRSSS